MPNVSKNRSSRRRSRRGVTLIEVLLVLVILLIIASMAVMAYGPIQRRAYINAARAQIKAFKAPIQRYYLDTNQYPASLDALLQAPADLPDPSKWDGPYLDSQFVPLDPWGNEYQYMYPGQNDPEGFPDIWSFGPDGVDGTEDDVTSWAG
ncbi:MAG: type II secretion system major pseudopilin GspG [Thermogutta sp.]